jgi:uncharacterized protein
MARILFDIGHPAHVHLFRGVAQLLTADGHAVWFTALDREIILYLLDYYELPYTVTYRRRSGQRGKLALVQELGLRTLATYRQAQRFGADVLVSFGNPTVGAPAWLRGKPYLALTDTEHAKEQHALFKPFATRIATPDVFTVDFGPRQVRYPGYHELAYLHPEQFTPDIRVLEPYGVQPGTPFFVVRFVAWRATHDVGQHGFSLEHKRQMLRELAGQGQVFLSVEETVDPEFEPLVTQFPPEIIHHLLAFARLYVGEGGTMASEAAVLGTPSIYVNTLTMGYIQDLQHTYGLLFQHTDGAAALATVRDVLQQPPETFAQRRQQLLRDKINPTPWLVDQIRELLGS